MDDVLLHCNLCGTSFGTRKNVWESHFNSKKHLSKLLGVASSTGVTKVQRTLEDMAEKKEELNQQATVAKAEESHRQRVMRAWVASGLPINALQGDLKELLEEKRDMRLSLGHTSNLTRSTIEPLLAELDQIDLETVSVSGGFYALYWDGYSKKDEHACVVMRCCSEHFVVVERVVEVRLFTKGLSGVNWTRVVDTVRNRLGKDGLFLSVADGHPSNGVVGSTFKGLLEHYFHSFCHSHTLSVVGSKTSAPLVEKYILLWNSMFKNSLNARDLVSTMMKENVQRKARVRWFANLNIVEQLMRWHNSIGKICEALSAAKYSEESCKKFVQFCSDNSSPTGALIVELLAFYDINKPLRDACYFLEGTGFLAPFVFEFMVSLQRCFVATRNIQTISKVLPNVRGFCATLPATVNVQHVWARVHTVIDPPVGYFLDNYFSVNGEGSSSATRNFLESMQLFKFGKLFHCVYGRKWISSGDFNLESELNVLVVKRFIGVLGSTILDDLKEDWKKFSDCYNAHVESNKKYRPDDLLLWWQTNGSNCGTWSAVARLFAMTQPSTASVERAFSMLRACIGDQQTHTLEDMVDLRIRTRFTMKDTSEGTN